MDMATAWAGQALPRAWCRRSRGTTLPHEPCPDVLPLGVDLRSGMVLRVDNYEEIKAPYLRCTNAGCDVQVELTAELVAQLKKGLKLQVGFRPFGSSKTVVIDASLKGFTRAFDRLK